MSSPDGVNPIRNRSFCRAEEMTCLPLTNKKRFLSLYKASTQRVDVLAISDSNVTDMSRNQTIGLLVSGVLEPSYCNGFELGG